MRQFSTASPRFRMIGQGIAVVAQRIGVCMNVEARGPVLPLKLRSVGAPPGGAALPVFAEARADDPLEREPEVF